MQESKQRQMTYGLRKAFWCFVNGSQYITIVEADSGFERIADVCNVPRDGPFWRLADSGGR